MLLGPFALQSELKGGIRNDFPAEIIYLRAAVRAAIVASVVANTVPATELKPTRAGTETPIRLSSSSVWDGRGEERGLFRSACSPIIEQIESLGK